MPGQLQVVSAPQFWVVCEGWTTGIGFSKLAGIHSAVEPLEYWYNGALGNVHTKQFGRAKPPTISLERGLDTAGFAQMFSWHSLARMNNPLAKVPAVFTMTDASGSDSQISYLLENAWCSKLEVDPASVGTTSVVMMKVTIECDAILPA
jgi:phage tail-like protein